MNLLKVKIRLGIRIIKGGIALADNSNSNTKDNLLFEHN